ncbi:helicase-related protein [Ferrimicrobium sp.]|uniref:helicase-related protein n=1 Tax=Ferrimicrobium sp. TaxID=2926050 RepID=UPI00261FC460|nr:helicase-related protein [Ferrimicrobium sp.]
MKHAVGSLVRVRGRDWVVLPESAEDLLVLRPLGGTSLEVAGVLTAIEPVESATFPLPSTKDLGDLRSARMLTDALKLGFRASAGPFRSFGGLGFEPRPYQLVPLMMALKLDPVRLLIADDVGVGKTCEALMICAELLAQGEIKRLCVLTPPHLAIQWQDEMATKFGLEAEVVLASTAAALERGCRTGETLFDRYPITIVSTDFIKADRRRSEFLRSAPEMIVVDEAHTVAADTSIRSTRHQRHQLIKELAADDHRHLILVTATPHSGNEDAFRSLLALLREQFANLPEDLSGDEHRRLREAVARHLVQRRRANLVHYLGDTQFPERHSKEASYRLSESYQTLLNQVFSYARSQTSERLGASMGNETGGNRGWTDRLRWWSAVALLRAIASSPAAGAATLRRRAQTQELSDPEDAERMSRQRVMDLFGEDEDTQLDEELGLVTDEDADPSSNARQRKLRELAKLADACQGDADEKLMLALDEVRHLLADGFSPIIFCRFIATAEYLTAELRTRLRGVEVRAVTGNVPSSERTTVVDELAQHPKRVLVATDCLSEGINLQDYFNAVVHYDLSWNPTRHEQREGRVDRFGQSSPEVRVVTCYGSDNRIDELVMEVLLRKHESIRNSLGVSIPVPGDPNAVAETLIRGMLSQGEALVQGTQLTLEGLGPSEAKLAEAWNASARREEALRSVFAQNTLSPDVVAKELEELNQAIGTIDDLRRFTRDALVAEGAAVSDQEPMVLHLERAPNAIKDLAKGASEIRFRFGSPPRDPREREASRVEPFIAGLGAWVLDSALDHAGPAARANVRRTPAVTRITALIVARLRFELTTRASQLLAEDVLVTGFGVETIEGDAFRPTWLAPEDSLKLLDAESSTNVSQSQAEDFLTLMLANHQDGWRSGLLEQAEHRGTKLRESHLRVREASRLRSTVDVRLMLPLDLVGLYVLLPGGSR